MKDEMRCVFQDNVAGEFSLQHGTIGLQFINNFRAAHLAETAYEYVGVLQVGRNVDSIDADERALEIYFARNDCAQFTFYEFVNPKLSVFHNKRQRPPRRTPYSFCAICSS